MMSIASAGGDAADIYLGYIATRHDRRHLDIRPEYYDLWLESLIATVRETDPEFDPSVEESWRSVLAYGVEYMRAHY